jgi:TolB protein
MTRFLPRSSSVLLAVILALLAAACGPREPEPAPAPDSFLRSAPTVVSDWTPDGADIVFMSSVSGNAELFFRAGGDTTWVNLTQDEAEDHWPEWSADGSRIVFYSERTGRRDIYAMNPDGSGLVQLTNDDEIDHLPGWTPDGRILFTSFRQEPSDTARAQHAYLMNADGTGLERVNLAGGGSVAGAMMGPDGTIVYGTTGPGRAADLWVATSEDLTGRRITDGDAVYGAPAFSPDGRWIAYHADDEMESHILVQDLSSGAVDTALTGGRHWYPRWSPDGRWILTCSEAGHGNFDVLVFPVDGSLEPRPLISGGARDCEARWRPVQPVESPPAS